MMRDWDLARRRVVQSLAEQRSMVPAVALTRPFSSTAMSSANTYPLSGLSMVMCIWAMIEQPPNPLYGASFVSLLMGMALCADGRAAVLILCVLILWAARELGEQAVSGESVSRHYCGHAESLGCVVRPEPSNWLLGCWGMALDFHDLAHQPLGELTCGCKRSPA